MAKLFLVILATLWFPLSGHAALPTVLVPLEDLNEKSTHPSYAFARCESLLKAMRKTTKAPKLTSKKEADNLLALERKFSYARAISVSLIYAFEGRKYERELETVLEMLEEIYADAMLNNYLVKGNIFPTKHWITKDLYYCQENIPGLR